MATIIMDRFAWFLNGYYILAAFLFYSLENQTNLSGFQMVGTFRLPSCFNHFCLFFNGYGLRPIEFDLGPFFDH
jgi:hypothetical protein